MCVILLKDKPQNYSRFAKSMVYKIMLSYYNAYLLSTSYIHICSYFEISTTLYIETMHCDYIHTNYPYYSLHTFQHPSAQFYTLLFSCACV